MLTHEEGCSLLRFDLVLTVLIDVNERVGCLGLSSLSTEGLFHDYIFYFHTHSDIIKSPPSILLSIVDERIVMSTFRGTIVDQDSMQIVWDVAIFAES